jgi:hypothetical protein
MNTPTITHEGNQYIISKDKPQNGDLVITDNVGAVGDVPLQRTNFLHALSCGTSPTACYRIVLFFVRWA